MNPELTNTLELARVWKTTLDFVDAVQELAGHDPAFNRAVKRGHEANISMLQKACEELAPIDAEMLPNGAGELAEFIRALEYGEVIAPKILTTDSTDKKIESGTQESRNGKRTHFKNNLSGLPTNVCAPELKSGRKHGTPARKNLPVPVLHESAPARVADSRHRIADVGVASCGEARESTESTPRYHERDSRGGQTSSHQNETAKYASESRPGSWGVRGLDGAAIDLSPAAKCGCAGEVHSPRNDDESPSPISARVGEGNADDVPLPSDEQSREVMSQWR